MLLIENEARRVLLAALPLLLASCNGCSSESNPADPTVADSGPADAKQDTAPTDASDAASSDSGDAGDAACPVPGPVPANVPEGWEAWTCWDYRCPMYVPTSKSAMPAPIEWEPCAPPIPEHLNCRWMKRTLDGEVFAVSASTSMARDIESGAPLIQFGRSFMIQNPYPSYTMVAEVDGDVRTAFMNPATGQGVCSFAFSDLGGNRYALSPSAPAASLDGAPAAQYGFIGGDIDVFRPQKVMRVEGAPLRPAWYVSNNWLVEFGSGYHKAWRWDLKTVLPVYSVAEDPDGLPPHAATVVGSDIFLRTSTMDRCGIMSWTEKDGLRPLLRWFGSTTKGAGNFGTDGADMVWTQTVGDGACRSYPPSSPEVWTAAYTTDPAAAQAGARRLRSDVQGMSPYPYAVGDGFAARATSFGNPSANSLFIVRLVDGVSWVLAGNPDGTFHWGLGVLGIMNGEVFVAVSGSAVLDGAGINIARIRLDSLGPGTPAD